MQEHLETLEYMLDRSLGNYNLRVINGKRSTGLIKEFYSQMAESELRNTEALKWAISELQGETV